MAKIIVTTKQLPFLREDTTTVQIPTDNNNASAALSKGEVQNNINNAQTTFGGNVTAQFNPSDGPGDVTISIPNANGGVNGAAEALKDNSAEVGKALSNNMNVGVDVSECKMFKKGDLEKARLKKMAEEGTVLTKKELEEGFNREIIDVNMDSGILQEIVENPKLKKNKTKLDYGLRKAISEDIEEIYQCLNEEKLDDALFILEHLKRCCTELKYLL